MKRPASKNVQPSGFNHDLPKGLTDYFNAKLELARTAKTSGTAAAVVYPTLAGFARVVRVSEPSIRNWARRYPAMAEAIGSCEAVRQEFAALDLPALVFDTEVEA